MLPEKIKSEYQKTQNRINVLRHELSVLPEGTLSCRKSGKYNKLYCIDKHREKYLKKGDITIASDLALKKYYEMQLTESEAEKGLLKALLSLQLNSRNEISAVLSEDSVYRRLLEKRMQAPLFPAPDIVQNWAKADYEKSSFHPENRIYKTISGIMVRSKSEVIIANVLSSNGIPFRYEAALSLKDITYYPDFTILHPFTQEIRYLEHFGMINKPEHLMHSLNKITNYISNGIIPSYQLICTFENSENPLDSDYVQKIVQLYFS